MIKLTQLDEKTLSELEELISICQQIDKNHIATYNELLIHPRAKPASLLLYHEEELIGFATAFFFTHDTAELSLLIHPAFRRKKLGSKLLKILLESIAETRPVQKIIFSVPHDTLRETLESHHFQFQNSEFEMFHHAQPILQLPAYTIRKATFDDMSILCLIDQQCFPTTHPYSEYRFQTLLNRENHVIFVLIHQGKIIGKAHVAWDEHSARLSDIAIIPTMQHQGFGKGLIQFCINYTQSIPRTLITLSVETHNKHALRLYQHLGFLVNNSIDYWSSSFQHLFQLMNKILIP